MGNFLKTVKGKIIIAAAGLAIILIAVLMFFVFNTDKGYRSISVSEIVGNVMAENNGKKYEAYKNMRLEGGYTLTTDTDSYTRMILDDDKYVKLEQLSRAVFEELGNKNRRRTSIRLENGVLTNELVSPLRDDESFVINTPNAVLAVRGTFFKVEVRYDESGEAFTDVYTYGGTVACKRVMPDGTVVDEDVIINSGYKACVKMDEIITVYVEEVIEYAEEGTENDDGEKEEIHDNVDPIEFSDINDSDLVDIYNASKNGHKMFVDTADFWNEIVERGIDLSEYHSVYDGGEIEPYDDTYIPDPQGTSGIQGEEPADPASDTDNDAQSAEESSDDSDAEDGESLSDEDESEEDSESAENDENAVTDPEDTDNDSEGNGAAGVGSYGLHNSGENADGGSDQDTADEGGQNDESDVNDEENGIEDEENDSEEDDNSDEAADSSTEDQESDKDNSGETASKTTIPYYGGVINTNTGGNTNTGEDTDKDTDNDTDPDADKEIGGIEINETNFPDEVFRNYVSESFDTDSSGYLSDSEIAAVTRINVSGTVSDDGKITSLQGTEHFKYLRALNCRYNSGLASLDLSGNADLYNLDVSFTGIESIDLSGNTALGYLYCNDTRITSLDVSSNTDLVSLYCDNCDLAYVDLSNNPGITTFSASGNKYSITAADGEFDTNTIVGFDISKVSELQGAEIGGNGVLSDIKAGAVVTYKYDCGQGKSATFTLVPNASSTFAPKFDGTIYMDNGSVTITETGFIQGDSAEETPYTGDYTITQKDSGTALEAVITVESGKHNITMDGVNISSENDAFTVGNKADLIISGGKNTNIISGLKNVIYNDGKIALSSGKFHLSANSADNTVETAAIYNNSTLKINGNTEINAETTENDGNASGFINNSSFVIEDDPKITILCQSGGYYSKSSDYVYTADDFSDAIKNKNGTFTVNGGTLDFSANYKDSTVIDNYSDFIFNDGSAVISAFDERGIYTFWNEGNFTVNGGTLNFKGDSKHSNGFECGDNSIFTLNGGTVNIISADYNGFRIFDCEFIINGGKLNINAKHYGIFFSEPGKFLVKGGSAEISGDSMDIGGTGAAVCIDGGSLRSVNGTSSDCLFTNSHGDELECVVYDTFPDESERTFQTSDGSSYVYKLEGTDVASDGKYYVWQPKADGLKISSANFPDDVFRNYVSTNFDTDSDGYLSDSEIAAVTDINVSGSSSRDGGITSLKGIEHFENLASLSCSNNSGLTSFDISSNKSLTKLSCDGTNITDLDVSKNTALTELYCDKTQITDLNLRNNTDLSILYCYETRITDLDLSNNKALTELSCFNNQITSLELSSNKALKRLACDDTQITGLDLKNNADLTYLFCENTQITELDVSSNKALKELFCRNCSLAYVDISNNPGITTFIASGNEHSITVTNGEFDTKTIVGFDFNKVSDLTGAVMDGSGVLSKIEAGTVVTYKYDCGNGNSETFTLVPDTSSTFYLGLEISAATFPDSTFMSYVSTNFDTDSNSYLSGSEIAAVTTINVSGSSPLIDGGITSLQGIEYFENLKTLNCYYNMGLTSLDISSNTALKNLNCSNTPITDLDVSSNKALSYLSCTFNSGLTSLDVSGNTALTHLYCYHTNITSLNVSGDTALIDLNCSNTQITSLDVSSNTALTELWCYNTQITGLDVNSNTALETLNCSETQIASLDVSNNTALTHLYCYFTNITSLDVSSNTALIELDCSNTQIAGLNVSGNTVLEKLYCYSTNITSLDVNSNTVLEILHCSDTQVTSLDVTSNTALKELYFSETQVTSLDVSSNTDLKILYCDNTKITSLDVSSNIAIEELQCSNCNLAYVDISSNPSITSFNASGNVYSISLDPSGQFDVHSIAGIDPSKISSVSGAVYDNVTGIFSSFAGDTVTYTYDCGNGHSATFTLKTTGLIMLDKSKYVTDLSDRLVIIPGVNDGTEDPDKEVTGGYHDDRVPDENKLVIIPGINDGTEESTETAVPEGEETASPEGEETASPEGVETASPEGMETASPEGEETAVPEGEETAVPEGAETAVPESVETAAPEVLMSAVADVLTAVVRSKIMISVILKFFVTAFLAIPIKLILIIFGGK